MTAGGDLWIFGYGSLMWRPGFEFAERRRARLDGYHRGFCIASTHHRGSPERPGLVLGLDRGGSCEGVAYRIAADVAASVLGYLRQRELVNGVYVEARVSVSLHDAAASTVRAIAYICERAHPSYEGRLSPLVQAHQIRGAAGISGENLDYLVNTVRHLREMDIRERELERIVTLAAPFVAHLARGDDGASPSALAIRRATSRLPDRARRMSRTDRRRFMYRLHCSGSAAS